MSVINQMLKDLDKRQGEQVTDSNVAVPVTRKSSNTKLVAIIVIVILLVNIAGIFAWQLYAENQQLKTQAQQKQKVTNLATPKVVNTAVVSDTPELVTDKLENKVATATVDKVTEPVATEAITDANKATSNETEMNAVAPEPLLAASTNVVESSEKNTPAGHSPIKEQEKEVLETKPTLTISRSQLSPKMLSEKKITEAERAMEVNDLAKAESLFEEVLLLIPEHETARKQLAALWYGKKAYQDAINLLSQGIAIAPQSEEMRLMSARIYFEQGRARQALNLLNPINNSQRVDLQVLIANIASEINEYKSAANAYRKLLILEPNVGRWWLGLAVSLDSQGQFKLASNAYDEAITKGNLSSNALQFARQRVAELGE